MVGKNADLAFFVGAHSQAQPARQLYWRTEPDQGMHWTTRGSTQPIGLFLVAPHVAWASTLRHLPVECERTHDGIRLGSEGWAL